MQIVPTTALAFAAILAILWLGPRRGLWAFFALTPFGAAAALNLPGAGGASIVLADAAALALFAIVLTREGGVARLLGTMRPLQPGFFLLVLFAFCVLATMVFPRLFAGQTEVFGIARVEGQVGIVTRPLGPTNGNLTQLFRVSLGVMVFLALATVFRRAPDPGAVVAALAVGTGVHATLGVLDVASHNAGAPGLLDPIRTANYAMADEQVMAGLKRMVGGFPEASAFGYHTMGLLGFWLQYWFDGGRFRGSLWFALGVVALLILSTSTAAYVAGAAFVTAFAALNAGRLVRRVVGRRVVALLGLLVVLAPIAATGLVLAYELSPAVGAYFDRLLFDKLASDSGVERMSWNAQAIRNFLDTWTVGAGLGSVRASNWLLACLASLGLLGTALYLAFIGSVFLCAPPPGDRSRGLPGDRRDEAAIVVRALQAGCLALLLRALVTKSTPNLELSFFAMAGLAAGLARGLRAPRPLAPEPEDGWAPTPAPASAWRAPRGVERGAREWGA